MLPGIDFLKSDIFHSVIKVTLLSSTKKKLQFKFGKCGVEISARKSYGMGTLVVFLSHSS